MDLFTVGDYTVTLFDVIVGGIAIVALLIFLIYIIVDIYKQSKLSASKKKKESKSVSDAGTSVTNATDASRKNLEEEKKSPQKERKRVFFHKNKVVEQPVDPLVKLLGFDPYAPITDESCEITETFYDAEQETEDMRILRERIQVAKITENRIKKLKERVAKVRYEAEKIARYIRDNKVVIVSTTTVNTRLRDEITALTLDKKSAKQNKSTVDELKRQLEKNELLASSLIKKVEEKTADEVLLRDVYNYLSADISRNERDLSFINSDIDRLNETVGAELKKMESENRAREFMKKYHQLRPLLETVNVLYREIKDLDDSLASLHTKKNELRKQLSLSMEKFKHSDGAIETGDVAKQISELNSQIVFADNEEEEIIRQKEEKIEQFKISKIKTNEFLDRENYELEDIITAEDKVVGEIEYSIIKKEYEQRKEKCAREYVEAQKRYDDISTKKVRFGIRKMVQKRAYEEELNNALNELKRSRSAHEKAISDCERTLPALNPMLLVRSGSGVISKERTSRRTETEKAKNDALVQNSTQMQTAYFGEKENVPQLQQRTNYGDNLPVAKQVNGDRLNALLRRLNELEEIARREKEKREKIKNLSMPIEDVKTRIEKRKAQVVAMRKGLRYIIDTADANEFKQKLYAYSQQLASDEKADEVLMEMIHRTMDDATALGEKGGVNG